MFNEWFKQPFPDSPLMQTAVVVRNTAYPPPAFPIELDSPLRTWDLAVSLVLRMKGFKTSVADAIFDARYLSGGGDILLRTRPLTFSETSSVTKEQKFILALGQTAVAQVYSSSPDIIQLNLASGTFSGESFAVAIIFMPYVIGGT